MKHSIEELIRVAYEYFPRGLLRSDPDYDARPESRRRQEAHAQASGDFEAWRAMLRRLGERFIKERLPSTEIENRSPFLQSPILEAVDRCFSGALWLPPREPNEKDHTVGFLISFVVPYYVIYSHRTVRLEPSPEPILVEPAAYVEYVHDTMYVYSSPPPWNPSLEPEKVSPPDTEQAISFDLSPDEAPFADVLVQEIAATFPAHIPMPSSVGKTIVPDVDGASAFSDVPPGQVTLYDTLFSMNW